MNRLKKFFKILGPGLITGASDDDPSGIATYSQAGAQYGLSTLWTAPLLLFRSWPLYKACARVSALSHLKGLPAP